MNNQKPMPLINGTPSWLEVNSIFYTIQGEGPFAGTPAVFVRLAGCNLQCPACDTEYTHNDKMSVMEVLIGIQAVQDYAGVGKAGGLVVITGGEPFRQKAKVFQLCHQLVSAGYYVQIETNGTISPPDNMEFCHNVFRRKGVYVVLSPKTPRISEEAAKAACAFKYVVSASVGVWPANGLPMGCLGMPHRPACPLPTTPAHMVYLQPLDEKDEVANKANTKYCVEQCLKFGYNLQVQIHKMIGVE